MSKNLRLSQIVPGMLIQGHRVASGLNGDPSFPGGTLAMQAPFFRERGLDLSAYPLATLNISIAPLRFAVKRSRQTLRDVAWHPTEPPEDFSFFDTAIRLPGTGQNEWTIGLVYYPHPETKPDHFQPPDMLEVLAESWISGLEYGAPVELALDPEQLEVLAE